MDETIEWLLEGSAWVEYKTRLDLLFQVKRMKMLLNHVRKCSNHQR